MVGITLDMIVLPRDPEGRDGRHVTLLAPNLLVAGGSYFYPDMYNIFNPIIIGPAICVEILLESLCRLNICWLGQIECSVICIILYWAVLLLLLHSCNMSQSIPGVA